MPLSGKSWGDSAHAQLAQCQPIIPDLPNPFYGSKVQPEGCQPCPVPLPRAQWGGLKINWWLRRHEGLRLYWLQQAAAISAPLNQAGGNWGFDDVWAMQGALAWQCDLLLPLLNITCSDTAQTTCSLNSAGLDMVIMALPHKDQVTDRFQKIHYLKRGV